MRNILFELVNDIWDMKFSNFNDVVKEAALKALIDSLSVGILGYEYDELAKDFINKVACKHQRGATILGGWWKGSVPIAAGANAFLCHTLEYDDWLRPGYVHAGTIIVPALLAYAENRVSWRELIENIVIGYELMGRIGAGLGRGHYQFWHATATAGRVALAVTLARMLGFSPEEAVHSGALAGYFCGGLWGFNVMGGGVKPFSPFNTVLTGIYSIELISSGGRTNTYLFETEKGLSLLSKNIDFNAIMEPPWSYAIIENGYKVYPCCRHTHTAIEAALKAKEEIGNQLNYVRSVDVYVFKEAKEIADIENPTNIYEAKFSLRYLTALALVKGEVDLLSIRNGLRDPIIKNMMLKIKIKPIKEFDERYPREQPSKVSIVLENGERIEVEEEVPRGDPRKPVSLDELLNKVTKYGSKKSKKIATQLYEKLRKELYGERVKICN